MAQDCVVRWRYNGSIDRDLITSVLRSLSRGMRPLHQRGMDRSWGRRQGRGRRAKSMSGVGRENQRVGEKESVSGNVWENLERE